MIENLRMVFFSVSYLQINLDDDDVMPKKYFVCPAAVRVMYLKKLIRLKYNLEDEHKVRFGLYYVCFVNA